MTDIVDRLREPIDPDDPDLWKVDKDRREAADEIERLRECVFKSNEAFVDADDRVVELERATRGQRVAE